MHNLFGFIPDSQPRLLKQGQGWRWGFDRNREYSALIGSEDWALELTEAEFQDFRRLLSQLKETMAMMATELMDEEKITCEIESDLLWLEAEGYPQAFSLHVILHQGRGCEGSWTAIAVAELIQSLEEFPDLGQVDLTDFALNDDH